jgi:hypothetical protein
VLAVSVLAGAVYVGGMLLISYSTASRAAAVAFAALAAYVLATRARPAVPLALAVLAVGVGLLVEPDVTDIGWFAYAPLSQARPVSESWSVALSPNRRLAIALLVAAVLLVVAVVRAPRRGSRKYAMMSVIVLTGIGYVGVRMVQVAGPQPGSLGSVLLDMVLGAWALVLAALALGVVATLGRGWPVTVGAVLVALVPLRLIDGALTLMPQPIDLSTGVAVLEPGLVASRAPLIGLGIDWVGALTAAALFGGVLLAALGLTRASASAPPVVAAEDPGDGVEA